MRDLHRRRSSGLALLLIIPIVVCVHTSFAATPNSSPSASEVTALPTATPLPPQIEGDLLMDHRSYAAALDAYQRDPEKSAVLWNKIEIGRAHV